MKRTGLGLLAFVLLALGAWAVLRPIATTTPAPVAREAPRYVGRATCAGCHADEHARWQGSHHDLAMQEAGPATVLGRFDGARLVDSGEETAFLRRGEAFLVRAPGADGVAAEHSVAYTFGVAPLQQYLLPLPDGRLQASTACWDARPAEAGGQRWYSLYPDEVLPPGDPLHWTGRGMTWNVMCADCHSTGVRRRFDPGGPRWDTTWTELDVSCEACHGPGSAHEVWARSGASPGDAGRGFSAGLRREEVTWTIDPATGNARRDPPPPAARSEVESCAPCHSRRGPLADGPRPGEPFLDAWRPALLEPGLYHPDGQILDEVYEWGSFLQSRMYHAGVSCSDCHEPHSLALRAPGDALCARCHEGGKYAVPAHTLHPPGTPGSRCVDCHMPPRTYMGVDARRDHSFRVPRPDLAARHDTPWACDACHADRKPAWAQELLGPRLLARPRPSLAPAFTAALERSPQAQELLGRAAADPELSGIARGSALALLRDVDGLAPPLAALQAGSRDPDPLVRLGAARALEALPPDPRVAVAAPLLVDARRAIRVEAARALAALPPASLPPALRAAQAAALGEWVAGQEANADRPEGPLGLGALHAQRGELEAAEAAYQRALRLDPGFVPTLLNLADLRRQQGRDPEAESLLRAAAARAPREASVQGALGLLLHRLGRAEESLAALREAARLAPREARHAFVLVVALHDRGRLAEAEAALQAGLEHSPHDRQLLGYGVSLARQAGDVERARARARRWAEGWPEDPVPAALLQELAGPR